MSRRPTPRLLVRGVQSFTRRHVLEIGVATAGVVLALALLEWSQTWGEALLGAFLAGGLVSIVYTEGEVRRRRSRERVAIRAAGEAARVEVRTAPLQTLSREVPESHEPSAPDTIESLVAEPGFVTFDARTHRERWATLTESLRERHDSFVSSVAVYLVDLTEDARRDVA